ncbi:MAG: enoyl-CoA hydratase/isomerase family protein [Alphaproteobacteria bacterium]|nr:enoyl-CoA hydratase/isomerase family protein [Alphaproteobacteria bacterium]
MRGSSCLAYSFAMTHAEKFIHYTVTDGIAEITFDRPPLNLIDTDLVLEYFAALEVADNDPDVRVVVITGAGKGLSAGMDLKFAEKFDAAEMKAFLRMFYVETIERCRALSKPMIAMVHGFAREGACTLAFACDMVIASDDATFGYPGVPNIGAPPGMHTWFLQKLMGRMKAADLIFTGRAISAAEADRSGLITRVVPRDVLREETMKLAHDIAAMSPLALKKAKDFMYQMEDTDFRDVPEAAVEAVSSAFDTEDSKEARLAFNQKRKPVWTGR